MEAMFTLNYLMKDPSFEQESSIMPGIIWCAGPRIGPRRALLSAHHVTVSNAVCCRLAYARERARQSWADGLDRPLPYTN